MQNAELEKTPCKVLLFGFNRPEFIDDRLSELMEIAPEELLVSIDWISTDQSEHFREILDSYSSAWPKKCKFEYQIHTSNQGLAFHITETVTKALQSSHSVIVLEDDISVSPDFIKNATEILSHEKFTETYASVGGFSVIKLPKILNKINFFRSSIYFQCWGWGTRSEIWDMYKLDLSRVDIESSLRNSIIWNQLSKRQKETWLGRFKKNQQSSIHTWDIQFQFLSFIMDRKHLLPVGRITDNLGFDDSRGSHIVSQRPWWLGSIGLNLMNNSKSCDISWMNTLIQRIESLSLIGDSQSRIPKARWLRTIAKKTRRSDRH